MKVIEKAVEYAAYAHDNQYRKKTRLPYVSHPVTVGFYLLQSGVREEVVAAAILHDVLEDTTTTFSDLEKEFGLEIATLVEGCSEPDKNLIWEERKKHTIRHLECASFEIKQIACADKLHNLRTIHVELQKDGDRVFEKFSRGREKQRWYYESILASLQANLTDSQSEWHLFGELEETIHQVFPNYVE
ncbi:HD domain-containing protein [Guptibacillus algicola]|uniref:HD domain-containing protein n=1 Tax=Guptibacillus algicola TaxID=225844 RepID=UPI001CD2503D|nr:HD domain-containing protein [Alkalihalobacillus algicola]MCA0986486.1 HD domain-containing protein [Alkalihalobacillus algicola]